VIDSPDGIQALWEYDDPVGSEQRYVDLLGRDLSLSAVSS